MLEVLRAHGVSEFTDGEMTVKFPPPSLDVEAIAAALDKVRAGEGLDDLPARKFSDGDRDDRRRLPRGEDAS